MTQPFPSSEHGGEVELPAGLRRKRRAVRIMLYWERIWRALWPVLALLCLFVTAALFDLFALLPFWLHALVLAVLAGLLVLALKPLLQVQIPSRAEALRRLEVRNGLTHRPLSSLADTLTLGQGDVQTVRLWAAHRKRLLAAGKPLKVGWPDPGMARHDPYALRAALLLALFVGVVYAGGGAKERLASALWPAGGAAAPVTSLDAWITPPSYTSRAPVFLSEGRVNGGAGAPREVNVPRGSELVARLRGVTNPELLGVRGSGSAVRFEKQDAGFWEVRAILEGGMQLQVRSAGRVIARWDVEVIPDRAPRIRLTAPPVVTPSGALKLSYEVADDYGVQSAEVRFRRDPPEDRDSLLPDERIDAPDFTLPLPGHLPKSGQQSVFRDLTAHPWAGLETTITLIVRDEAGQEGRSAATRFTLPMRRFTKPMAQAVVEQRQLLALDSDNRWDVGNAISALTIAPERFGIDTTVFLGLRAVYRHLHRIEDDIDVDEILHLLWDIALRIEDDGVSLAARDLRAAQEALRRALERGESGARLAQAISDLKQALANYMQAMRKNQGRQKEQTGLPGAVRTVRPDELMRMIEEIEQLARSGGAKAASDMLARLQSVLESLQNGPGQQAGSQAQAMNRWLDRLDGLMRDQQKLMERSYRPENQAQGRAQGKPAPAKDGDLRFSQDELRRRLNELRKGLGQLGLSQPEIFGAAERAMKRAAKQLGEGARRGAAYDQGQALENMRQGMRGVAQQILGRMASGAGPGRTDPLGRRMNGFGRRAGGGRNMPGQGELGKAYEIRKELEKRLGERGRPMLERHYLERLLKQF